MLDFKHPVLQALTKQKQWLNPYDAIGAVYKFVRRPAALIQRDGIAHDFDVFEQPPPCVKIVLSSPWN